MENHTQEKLAGSLTARTTDLLPHLPYLLQDFWELGSSPGQMVQLVQENTKVRQDARALDLGCGKGAVSIALAGALGIQVTGVDLLEPFIDEAVSRADEAGVAHLCRFVVGDIAKAVESWGDFDLVIMGAVGSVLGDPATTLERLYPAVKPGGYLLLDDAYLREGKQNSDLRYCPPYPTQVEWEKIIRGAGYTLVACVPAGEEEGWDEADNEHIAKRAGELSRKYPHMAGVFAGYVQSQRDECHDLEHTLTGATWLLNKAKNSGLFRARR